MHATQPMAGTLTITLHDRAGRVWAEHRLHNLVTDAGRSLVAGLFAGKRMGPLSASLVVGAGAEPASPADTRLHSELDRITVRDEHIRVDGPRVGLTARIPERDTSHALREAGICLALGADPEVLYNRVVFDVINKAPNMQMTLTWSVDFGGDT